MFEVGDCVRVVESREPFYRRFRGQLGFVTSVRNRVTRQSVFVRLPCGPDDGLSVYPGELEFYTSEIEVVSDPEQVTLFRLAYGC